MTGVRLRSGGGDRLPRTDVRDRTRRLTCTVPLGERASLELFGPELAGVRPTHPRRVIVAQFDAALEQRRCSPTTRRGAASRWRRPIGCAARCSPRSATTCAGRSPRRRPPSPACARQRREARPTRDRAELLATRRREPRRPRRPRHRTCSTSAALQAGVLAVVPAAGRRRGRRCRAVLDELAPRAGRGAARHPGRRAAGPRRRGPAAAGGRQPRWRTRSASRRRRRRPRLSAERVRRPGADRGSIDRGPGVPDERRDAMFVPFQRSGDTDNSTGIGLGLALSQGFVEGMGGTLEAEDTPGGGLTMVIALPLVRALGCCRSRSPRRCRREDPDRRRRPADPRGAAHHAHRPRLRGGHRPRRQGRPRPRPSHEHPDLVVLDLGMPGLDGRRR